MYQDNTVTVESVCIVKNMPNDEGKLYIQVFNAKGNYIAIDKDEFLRQVTSLEGTIEFMQKRIKEDEDRQSRTNRESNERWQKMSNAFDKYKATGRELVIETLEALSSFKQFIKSNRKRLTDKQKDQIYKAEKLFKELNSVDGRFKNFYERNYTVGPQQVTNTELLK